MTLLLLLAVATAAPATATPAPGGAANAAAAPRPKAADECVALALRGDFAGALGVADAALAAPAAKDPGVAAALRVARAQVVLERHRLYRRAPDEVARALDEAEAAARAAGSDRDRADALHLRARVRYEAWLDARGQGRQEPPDGVEDALRAALALRERSGDLAGQAASWFYLGLVGQAQGPTRHAAALERLRTAQALARKAGDAPTLAYAELHLGVVLADGGGPEGRPSPSELDEAEAALKTSLALRREAGALAYVPASLNALANFRAAWRSDLAGAVTLLRESAKAALQANNRPAGIAAHAALADLLNRLGATEEAEDSLRAAGRLGDELGGDGEASPERYARP